MEVNFPELDQVDPDTQRIINNLHCQQQAAAPAASADIFRQHKFLSRQHPQDQAYISNQGMHMVDPSFTTPPFANTPTLKRPSTNAGLAFQLSPPYSYGQIQQRELTYIPFPDALPDPFATPNNAPKILYQGDQLGSTYTPLPSTIHEPNTGQPQRLSSVAGW